MRIFGVQIPTAAFFYNIFFLAKKTIKKVKIDMSNETNYIGNLSSLVKTISMLIAGAVIGILVNFGLKLPIDTATLAAAIGSLIWLGISYIDMKYPNTIFPQKTETPTEPEVGDLDVGEEDGC